MRQEPRGDWIWEEEENRINKDFRQNIPPKAIPLSSSLGCTPSKWTFLVVTSITIVILAAQPTILFAVVLMRIYRPLTNSPPFQKLNYEWQPFSKMNFLSRKTLRPSSTAQTRAAIAHKPLLFCRMSLRKQNDERLIDRQTGDEIKGNLSKS